MRNSVAGLSRLVSPEFLGPHCKPVSLGPVPLYRLCRFPGLVRHNHFLRAEPWPPPPKKQARPNK